jgi:RNA polymerase sigma-70 factor (ECF subfamily)
VNKKEIETKSDEQLVELSIKDQKYYLYLMKRYENKLVRYILRISNLTKEDAEDVLQEVFVSVYKNLQGFDQRLKFSSWIYRITHNQTISYIRKIKSRPQTIDIEDTEILDRIATNKEMDIQVHNEIEKERILKEINSMDIKYKSVLVLRLIEEKEYNEISDILKIPKNTVGTLINRARKQLIEKLGDNQKQ